MGGYEGKTYALTGPAAIFCDDIARAISEATGKPVKYERVSDEMARSTMRGEGLPEWLIAQLMELNGLSRAASLSGISDHAEMMLGRQPTSFKKFAEDFRELFLG